MYNAYVPYNACDMFQGALRNAVSGDQCVRATPLPLHLQAVPPQPVIDNAGIPPGGGALHRLPSQQRWGCDCLPDW